MNHLYSMIVRIVRNGIKNGEIIPTIDSETFTTIFISTIEGSLMMTKLYYDPIYINRSIGFLRDYLTKLETTNNKKIATNTPGFSVDEPFTELEKKLMLPSRGYNQKENI